MKYLLLDGYNLAFRAFYAMPELTNSTGTHTGALHGWIKALWKVVDLEGPAITAVYFDEGGAADREALLESYKANRTEMPEPLTEQMPLIREVTELMGVPIHSQNGIEADDLMAAAALMLCDRGDEAVIVSADKDLGQVLRPGIVQLLPAPTANPKLGWRRRDAADLEAKLGVKPEQVPDYLALIGDTSDNVKGLAGCGPKTAAKWLKEYGDLEGVIANAAHLNPRFREVVPAEADRLRQNLQIVTLDPNVMVPEPAEHPVKGPELLAFLERMEMKQAAKQATERYRLDELNLG
ncbi:MAG: 5'-3' exonuclease H3TH domain-containing protein [Opitutales bacterium]